MPTIGHWMWEWVEVDAPGVPTGGRYGHPRDFAEKIKPLRYGLAWSHLWDCFFLYHRRADGRIMVDFQFKNFTNDHPLPVHEGWLPIVRYMKDKAAGRSIIDFLAQERARRKYEAAVRRAKVREMIRDDVIRATDLRLGLLTPRTTVVIPGPTYAKRQLRMERKHPGRASARRGRSRSKRSRRQRT